MQSKLRERAGFGRRNQFWRSKMKIFSEDFIGVPSGEPLAKFEAKVQAEVEANLPDVKVVWLQSVVAVDFQLRTILTAIVDSTVI